MKRQIARIVREMNVGLYLGYVIGAMAAILSLPGWWRLLLALVLLLAGHRLAEGIDRWADRASADLVLTTPARPDGPAGRFTVYGTVNAEDLERLRLLGWTTDQADQADQQ